MKTIITIQHTQSVHHTNGMVGSWTDWDLTDLGKAQAENIGRNLRAETGNQDFVLYSSDLRRAQQTAAIVARYFGISPILKPALRERNLGKSCGKSVQWLRANIECQERTVDDKMFHDAESRRDVYDRLRPFFDEMTANPCPQIMIVSHGDLLSVLNIMLLGLPAESLNRFELSGLAGGVSHILLQDDGKTVFKRMSDMSYIELPTS